MLVFPEGRKGTEKLYKDRYRLRRFGRGGFVEAAMRAQGADRPGRGRRRGGGDAGLRPAQRAAEAHRADLLPDHADVPALRAARRRRLPAGQVQASASWSRSRPTSGATSRGTTAGWCRRVAEDVRARIQEELYDMLAERRRCGSDERASSSPASRATGAAGSPRRSSATPTVEVIIGVSPDDPTLRARAHRVRPRRHPARAAAADRARGARSTRWSTRGWSSTRATAPPRVAHEANVIGTMNILAACGGPGLAGAQGRLQVLRALLRLRARRPGVLHRGHAAPAPAAHAAGGRHRRGREGGRRASPSATRTSPSPRCASATASGPDLRTAPHRAARRCPRCRAILGFDPRYQFIHEDDIVGVLEHAVARRPAGRLQRRAATACSCCRRSRACSASRSRRCCRRGAPAWPPPRCGRSASALPARGAQPAALRPRRRQPQAQGRRAAASRHTTRETVQAFAEAAAGARRSARERGAPYRYEREVEEFLRWQPERAAATSRRAS